MNCFSWMALICSEQTARRQVTVVALNASNLSKAGIVIFTKMELDEDAPKRSQETHKFMLDTSGPIVGETMKFTFKCYDVAGSGVGLNISSSLNHDVCSPENFKFPLSILVFLKGFCLRVLFLCSILQLLSFKVWKIQQMLETISACSRKIILAFTLSRARIIRETLLHFGT